MDYNKKVISYSNYWYNDGLKKAQIRDLSGAITSLKRSLQYNKGNKDARNLLGLVYYGRGEIAEALVEWIISKNLHPRDNIAGTYIAEIQKSPKELEIIDQAIHKFNQALAYCEQGGTDLAIIQLKRVIQDHPTFLKAYQLLALIYLETEQYAKARQLLKTARKIDTTNDITLRYIHELTQGRGKKAKKVKKKRPDSIEYNVGNEMIIQPAHHAIKFFTARAAMVNIIVGILIGAALIWFLVTPTVEESKAQKWNKEILEYSQRINTLDSQVSALTRTLDQYRSGDTAAEGGGDTNAASTADSYENLMAAESLMNSDDYTADSVSDYLLNVNRDLLGGTGQQMYDEMRDNTFSEACDSKYAQGKESVQVGNYDNAIDQLSKVLKMDEKYDDYGAKLQLGIAYLMSGDNEKATVNLSDTKNNSGNSEYVDEANRYLESIAEQQQNTEQTE